MTKDIIKLESGATITLINDPGESFVGSHTATLPKESMTEDSKHYKNYAPTSKEATKHLKPKTIEALLNGDWDFKDEESLP